MTSDTTKTIIMIAALLDCEMMLGWAGYTREQISKRIADGRCCKCDAHNGGVCEWTGKRYFAKRERRDENLDKDQ